MYFDEVDEKQK